MDWSTTVQELIANERQGMESALNTEESNNQSQLTAYSSLNSALTALQTSVTTLNGPTSNWYQQTVAMAKTTSTVTSALSGSSNGTTPLGTYNFTIYQPATPTTIQGTAVSESLTDADLSHTLQNLNIAIPVSFNATDVNGNDYGQFTVDGNQVSIYPTDTLQKVFDDIASATDNKVTASLSNNEVVLSSSSGPITVGSGADTTNFLEAMQLYSSNATSTTNGSGDYTLTSQNANGTGLGAMNIDTALSNVITTSNLTGLTNGAGSFTINGKTINYNINSDSVQSIMNDIDQSGAGVLANFDTGSGQLTLTNSTGGSTAISLNDSTGLLSALGLGSSATTTYGQNCIFSVNGSSSKLTSNTNTLTPDVTGIEGLTVTVNPELMTSTGTTNGITTYAPYSDTATVANSTSNASTMINNFITTYNTVNSLISKDTNITINADKSVTTGPLSEDYDVQQWGSDLSNMVFKTVNTGISTVTALYQIGLDFNTTTGNLSIVDQTAFDNALNNNPNAVAAIFNTPLTGTGSAATGGVAGLMSNYIQQLTSSTGEVQQDENALNTDNTDIQNKLTQDETKISQDQATLVQGFQAMETAMSQFNDESKAISAIT